MPHAKAGIMEILDPEKTDEWWKNESRWKNLPIPLDLTEQYQGNVALTETAARPAMIKKRPELIGPSDIQSGVALKQRLARIANAEEKSGDWEPSIVVS